MLLTEFRERRKIDSTVFACVDATDDAKSDEPTKGIHIAKPVTEPPVEAPASQAAATDDANEDDDDLDYSWDIDQTDLNNLKDCYNFLDHLIDGILTDTVTMPIDLVKELEIAINDIHELINSCAPYKPEDAGKPEIACTLEDCHRGDISTP